MELDSKDNPDKKTKNKKALNTKGKKHSSNKKENTEKTDNTFNTLLKMKRGRPLKYGTREKNKAENASNLFLKSEKRIKNVSNDINLSNIENHLNEIFIILDEIINKNKDSEYQEFLYLEKIGNHSRYSFKQLIIENWNKEENNIFPLDEIFCYEFPLKKGEYSKKLLNKYNLDQSFFLFLKHISKYVNNNYFFFVLKFVVILREYINAKRKDFINDKDKSKNRELYSQVYNAEIISEISNDFFLIFLELFNLFEYFKLDEINEEDELKELTQYLSYWLYKEGHIESHLSLFENKKNKNKKNKKMKKE